MNDLRPAEPKAVQSIKDLKLEIEASVSFCMEHPDIDKRVAQIEINRLEYALALINEFEAGLRGRLKICDDLVGQLKRDGEKWEYHPARVESLALRAVLGSSEGGK